MKRFLRIIPIILLLIPFNLYGQAGTSGSLTGNVTTEGRPLPGVTVSITSPALQGTRTAVSGETGAYNFPSLPPGLYTVTFDLEGMQQVTRTLQVSLAQTSRADAELRLAAVAENLTVVATAPAVLETSQIASNFTAAQIEELPVDRSIRGTVLLAPGVNDSGPNAVSGDKNSSGQITISGAQSFDNLFLVNGVVVNENLRGQPRNLFIEDAIQETTVLTGGVSAEYGRFTGGVVSTITKSGGNDFSGSLRDNLTNDSWTEKTDFAAQADPISDVNHQYEATLGGRIIRDRLWFFGAGRYENRNGSDQTFQTAIPFATSNKDKRWEGKLTGQITSKHSLVASYLDDQLDRTGVASGRILDLRSLATRTEPNSLLAVHYSGILTSNFLLEGQYSKMDYAFAQGGEQRDLINGTILLQSGPTRRAWSPTFCGEVCGLKERNNKEYLLKSSYFLSTSSLGTHNLVGGYDDFHQLREENNFQSGSDYRIHGHFFFDSNNQMIGFGVDPTEAQIEWDPVPALSDTSDFAVRSLFFNDKWDLNNRWTFNAGLRYDKDYGTNQAGVKTVDDSAFSPRLAASFDPMANGRHRFNVTYGRYVSKVDQGPADFTATSGRYASYYFNYLGPEINPVGTPASQLVPIPQVIQRVFDWFNSVGGHTNTGILDSASVPGVTTRFDKSLVAPYLDEITAGYGLAIGKGYIKADYIHRTWDKFYTIRRTLQTGTVIDGNGDEFDQGVIENSTGDLDRTYNGVQLQATYRVNTPLSISGNYTFSKLRGNVEGEDVSFATTFTDENNYPEYTNFANNHPVGNLDEDMRHRLNLWLQYDLPTSFGRFNFSVLERYHSALPYSGSALIATSKISNPGYVSPPSSATYFFTERGAFRVDSVTSTDLGLNYYLPVGPVNLFFQGDVLNLFDEQAITDPSFIDQTVLTSRQAACTQLSNGPTPGARCLAFNPFTETPVEGIHYRFGPNFGNPTTVDAYQLPRTYRFSVGVRF